MFSCRRILSILLSVPAIFILTCNAFSAPEITWEVENRFRFYAEAEPFKAYLAVADEARAAGTSDWILGTERKLQQKVSNESSSEDGKWNGWAAKWRNDTCWDRQRFLLLNDDRCEDYVVPTSHRILLTVNGTPVTTKCTLKADVIGAAPGPLFNKRKKQIESRQVNVGCRDIPVEVPFSVNGNAGVEVTVTLVQVPPQTLAPVKIFVKDILVLGMGDLFAAGVGNPDLPSRMDRRLGIFYDDFITHRLGVKRLPVRRGGFDGASLSQISAAQAEWLDIRCFRSQYGPQFRTALHLAADLRHSAVTFLDLACDGARIIEGLLHRKELDSGYTTSITNPEAQLGLASRLLCADPVRPKSISYKLRFVDTASQCSSRKPNEICEFSERDYQREDDLDATSMRVCGRTGADAFRRTIDVLLLSVGGNDIGFAPMVGDILMGGKGIPDSVLRRLATDFGVIYDGEVGKQRLGLLRGKYEVLDEAIGKYLPVRKGASKPIFITAYPLPVDDRSGAICGSTSSSASAARDAINGNRAFEGFEGPPSGSLNRLKSVVKTSCLINIQRLGWFNGGSDAGEALTQLTAAGQPCEGLQNEANTGLPKIDWQFEFAMLRKWHGHGFCSVKDGADTHASLGIPVFSDQTSAPWTPPFNNMRPYESRQRWIRTPNDAFVITNWHTYSVRLSDFANHLAASTTSAMHPTAEGYASIADSLRDRVAKYVCSERASEFGSEPLCAPP